MSTRAWKALLDAASAPYRRAGRFAWHFARGKLRHDPVFRHLIEEGLIRPEARVLDIGCGQGLLASLLTSAAAMNDRGQWPPGWAPAPRARELTGIELMPRDVARAQAALGDRATFVCADMRHAEFPACDVVVILDVLHYIDIPAQNDVLARVRRALAPGGKLLLRVGDASARGGFLTSQWVDSLVVFVRGHRAVPQFGRPLAHWVAQLRDLGLEVDSKPMSRGTPFANVLLLAQAPVGTGSP
jgi:SAM-dependent methyltransferase